MKWTQALPPLAEIQGRRSHLAAANWLDCLEIQSGCSLQSGRFRELIVMFMRKLIMTNTRANNTPSSIVFPSRAKRDEGRLRDCFRIMAWKQFKQEYRGDLTGLNLYAVFEEDWKKHEIQGWDYQKMSQFADELGYSAAELLKARNRYYELRDQARAAAEAKQQPMQQPMYQQPMYQQPYYAQPIPQQPQQFVTDEPNPDESPF
jgi:hypothetical protein